MRRLCNTDAPRPILCIHAHRGPPAHWRVILETLQHGCLVKLERWRVDVGGKQNGVPFEEIDIPYSRTVCSLFVLVAAGSVDALSNYISVGGLGERRRRSLVRVRVRIRIGKIRSRKAVILVIELFRQLSESNNRPELFLLCALGIGLLGGR